MPRPQRNPHPAKRPWLHRAVYNRFLRVPRIDWIPLKSGHKKEWRVSSESTKLPVLSKEKGRDLILPTPIILWTPTLYGAGADSMLMVVENVYEDRLGAITPESVRAEGFETLAEFRDYWMHRTKHKFRPLNRVAVYTLRPWKPETDSQLLGAMLFEQLYQPWTHGEQPEPYADRP